MFYALSAKGMPFDSAGMEQVFVGYLRPYKNGHIRAQSIWGMTVAEEMLTFDVMCEKNGIDPCDGLDMLPADPNWFAVDDGAASAPTMIPRRHRRGPPGAAVHADRTGAFGITEGAATATVATPTPTPTPTPPPLRPQAAAGGSSGVAVASLPQGRGRSRPHRRAHGL